MTWRHISIFFWFTVATYLLHEAGHWAMGEVLGYDMWVNINSAGLARGEYSPVWHKYLVAAGGPLVTVIQAVIAFVCVRRYQAIAAFAFLFAAFMMRFVAMLVSISKPNDEAAISIWLGLGPWTLHFIVVAVLLALCIKAGAYVKFTRRSYLLAYLTVSLAITIIVMGEPYLTKFNPYI